MLPGRGSHGAAQGEQRQHHALRPFGHRPFMGRFETIDLDLAWPDILGPDILDSDIAKVGSSKRRFDLRGRRADRNWGRDVNLRRG